MNTTHKPIDLSGLDKVLAPLKINKEQAIEILETIVEKERMHETLQKRAETTLAMIHGDMDARLKTDIVDLILLDVRDGYKLNELVSNKYIKVREAVAYQGYGLDTLVHDDDPSVCTAVAEQGYGFDTFIKRYNTGVGIAMAEQGYGLEQLVKDEHWRVRQAVARQGYGLDILINDEEAGVRAEVARQGYGLDTLVNDKDKFVRAAVARQGYGLDTLIHDKWHYVRQAIAEQGYRLDTLVKDESSLVRIAVAEQGYGLDKLVNDEKAGVRAEVARQGYGLDTLVHDEEDSVRKAVARQGYGLDTLVKDEEAGVRAEVARQGYGLDTLVYDEDEDVRIAVAKQGYGLDKLVNDEDTYVRAAAYRKILDSVEAYVQHQRLVMMLTQDKSNYVRQAVAEQGCGLEQLVNDENWEVRREVARHGYGLDKLVNDKRLLVRQEVAMQGYGLEHLINDESDLVRAAVARQGYGLDILINDEEAGVRAEVARQGYGLDTLVNDKAPGVRIAVAQQGYGLDKLVHDEDKDVREEVAYQGYGLDVLVNDAERDIRVMVARQGYGLDKLVNDEDTYVRQEVAMQGYGLDKLVKDKDAFVRKFVAEHGYGLDTLINDEWFIVRQTVAEQGYGLEQLIKDQDARVRQAVARQQYGLDTLIHDEDWRVRMVVAQQGYGLDKLVHDEDWRVRATVGEQGYGLEQLVNDEVVSLRRHLAGKGVGLEYFIKVDDFEVRQSVARHGYGLDTLINDENDFVRKFVAEQGYGLDKLVHDESSWVRSAVAKQGYKPELLMYDRDEYIRENAKLEKLKQSIEKIKELEQRKTYEQRQERGANMTKEYNKDNYLHIEFSESGGAGEKNYTGVIIDDTIIDELEALDKERTMEPGYCKFYIEHVKHGEVVYQERIDIGDGPQENKKYFDKLREIQKEIERENSLAANEAEPKKEEKEITGVYMQKGKEPEVYKIEYDEPVVVDRPNEFSKVRKEIENSDLTPTRKIIINHIMDSLEKGESPQWTKTWESGQPHNPITGTKYRGENLLALGSVMLEKGYKDPRWITFNQAKQAGISIIKGNKGTPICFYRPKTDEEINAEKKKILEDIESGKLPPEAKGLVSKYIVNRFTVFNAEQCTGFPELKVQEISEESKNKAMEEIIKNSPAPIIEGPTSHGLVTGCDNFYSPAEDKIHVAYRSQFQTQDDFYATVLHEIAHSTGHESRLNRGLEEYGSNKEFRAKEELVAEIASSFLTQELGLGEATQLKENHVAYISSWQKVMKDNYKEFFDAIKKANEAGQYIREHMLSKEVKAELDKDYKDERLQKQIEEKSIKKEKMLAKGKEKGMQR